MPDMRDWKECEIEGHVCHVYEPAEIDHQFTVLYLHGVKIGRLKEQHAILSEFDRHRLRVVIPITQRSWWSDRICPEFDTRFSAERFVLDHVVPWLDDEFGARPPEIGLFGISMGGQGALRLAYKHPDVFPVVAALSPAVDFQQWIKQGDPILQEMYRDTEDARQDTATLHIHPLNWPRHQYFCCDPTDHEWFEGVDRLRMKLHSLGVPFVCDLETEGGGHGYAYYDKMSGQAVEFVAERLRQERLRVP